MPFEVNTRDLTRLSRKLERLGTQGEREQDRALKDSRRRSLTFVNRDIRKEYAVKVSPLKKELAASPVRELAYTITGSRRSISLQNFGNLRQVKKGVAVTLIRGARSLYRTAFQVKTRGGQVFWRARENGKRVGRLPIERIGGPTAAQMFDKEPRLVRTRRFVSDRLGSELTKRYERLLRKG